MLCCRWGCDNMEYCLNGKTYVSRVLLRCFKGVPRVCLGCFKEVSSILNGRFKDLSKKFQGCLDHF